MAIDLDSVSKTLTVVSLCIAVAAAWKALPLDAEIKSLQVQTQRLDLDLRATESKLKEAEARLREAESTRKLSFDLYEEVKRVLEKKERTPRDEEALRVLVEALADDPFRYKLLSVLAVSATTPDAKRSAAESSTFFQEEAQLSARQLPDPATAPGSPAGQGGLGAYDIDVFYCSARRSSAEPIAQKVMGLKRPDESGRWRLRALPETINQQPGYGVASNEIRFNAPVELSAATLLEKRLAGLGVPSRLRESQQLTKWYISVFICQ